MGYNIILGIVCGAFLVLILVVYYLTRHQYEEDLHYISKKEYKLKELMPLALWVIDHLLERHMKPKKKIREHILLIYGKREYHYRIRMYEAEKVALGIVVLMGVLLLTLLISVQSGEASPIQKNQIKKPLLGEGSTSYELQAEIDIDGDVVIRDFSITVPEEIPHEEVAKEKLQEVANKLKTLMIKRSQNPAIIDRKLYLPKKYAGGNILIEWQIDTPLYLHNSGELRYENITKEGASAAITATLTYGLARHEQTYKIQVYPKNLTREERLQLIEEALQAQLESETLLMEFSESVTLPTGIEEHSAKIRWLSETEGTGSLRFFILGILVIVFILLLKDYELKQKVDARNHQIRLQFPEFVIKLSLLMNAGMTLSRAWTCIGKDYIKQLKKGEKPVFLYEELLVTLQDIQNGVSEAKAYEGFGKRCKIPEMLRFTSVVTQNIKKGNDTLLMALQGQANEAWEVRKNMAKKEGEKASSKLLLPMGMMFIIIIIIVMMPAFLSFSM